MNVSLNDATTILTAVVAVAGLALSIYNFYVDRKDKTPRLTAKIANGFFTNGGPQVSEAMILLEVANPGEKIVKVTAVEIKWEKRKLVFIRGIDGTAKIPFELQPGNSASFWIPMQEVALAMQQNGVTGKQSIKACFRTAIGNEFLSKKLSIDLDAWEKS